MIILTNDFHRTEARVDDTKPITKDRIRKIRKRLCGVKGCTCSGTLGERGKQAENTEAFLNRANQVILSSQNEEQPDPVCLCGKTSEGTCPRCGQKI